MTRKSQGSFYDMLPQEKKDELRAAYKAAVDNNAPGFTAIGHEWVTSYVKYLFEYVDGRG